MKPHKRLKRLIRRARVQALYRLQPATPLDPGRTTPPVVVAALGGSGTRVIVDLLTECGVFMGDWIARGTRDSLFLRLFLDEHFDRLVRDPEREDAAILRDLHRTIRAHRIGIPGEGDAWGWKNPRSMWLLPWFIRRYPGLRFVHLVRDGRDLALSRNRFLLERHGRKILGDRWTGDPIRDQLELWSLGNSLAADACDRFLGPRALVIRYEDLCADPTRAVGRLLEFLGRSLPPPSIARIAATVKPSPGLGRGRLDRSEALRESAERHAAVLRRFGYSTPG